MSEYKIERVGNYGKISPIPTGKLASALLKYMSYERQGKEFMPNPAWALVKLYSVKRGLFPWGFKNLVSRMFKQWCSSNDDTFYFVEKDRIHFVDNIDYQDVLSSSNLRDYQIKGIDKLIQNWGGIICMPTGSGKTKTIIAFLKIFKIKSTVIVTTLDIKKQWELQVKDYPFIKIINYQSPKCDEYVKNSKIVVFDECHHVSAKTIYHLAMIGNTDSIFIGCSATPEREDGESMRINAALGDIVYQVSRRELINQGYLADADVLYIDLHQELKSFDDKLLGYPDMYKNYIVENSDRNEMIIRQAIEHLVNDRKVLILVSQIEHGQQIFNEIDRRCNENNLVYPRIYLHGSSRKEDREKNLSQFYLIVGSNIFNEGVDLPSFDVLIIAAGGKSSIQLTQRIGRVLRPQKGKKALIIDFIDSRRYLIDHYKKRRAILEEDFEVTEI